LKKLSTVFLNLYVVVYALYAYLNKGVAYAFLAEALLLIGIFLIFFNLDQYILNLNKPVKVILIFIIITCIAFIPGVINFPLKVVAQDASMFLYAGFVFVVFLFRKQLEELKVKIYLVYRWFPIVVFVNFMLVSYVPFFQKVSLFGGVPLMLYKYGDMSVHLLICTLLIMCGEIKMSRRWLLINILLISYLFLIIATYNRAGMITYLLGLLLFLIAYRKRFTRDVIVSYLRFVPLLICAVAFFYVNTRVEENFQGRRLGLEQLKNNILSIVSNDIEEGGLSDNKFWRLAWWYSILQKSTDGKNILVGRGLGEDLVMMDGIKTDDENLRSPHNFHLNVLARFGYPLFFLWIWWIFLHLKKIKPKKYPDFQIMLLVFFVAYIFNASFDVYLEGPMGAFPFWTWLGILYLHDSETVLV
jgi:hypothetical protein